MIAENTFNDCLHIEHTRVKRGLFLPRQVVFRLNSQVLAQLEAAKTENVSLVINPSRLTQLRFYAFLNSGLSELENFKDQQHFLEIVIIAFLCDLCYQLYQRRIADNSCSQPD